MGAPMAERSPVAGRSTPSLNSFGLVAVVVPLLVGVVVEVGVLVSGWQATIQILVAMLNTAIIRNEIKRLVMF
jgi:hypothetical protein